MERLEILKALGDNTRYAIYLELARSPIPLATGDISRTLDLHPNTVRPHLERMREVGLLDQRVDTRGGVGRPQHLYFLAADAPSLGFEPPAYPRLATMLVRMATAAGISPDDAVDAGRDQGTDDARRVAVGSPCVPALASLLGELGFDPAEVATERESTLAFMHCPYRDLAERNPALVCGLHRGLVEGFVDARGGARVTGFRTLVDRDACQVDLAVDAPPSLDLGVPG
jgi:predicted ArsR family transcriptional regulator